MTVSDGDGQRQNKQYCIGFIGTRDGRAEGIFFRYKCTNSSHAAETWSGSNMALRVRFISKSDCTLIQRNGIRDAETHLSLRFPWDRGRPALSAYAFATKLPGDVWDLYLYLSLVPVSVPVPVTGTCTCHWYLYLSLVPVPVT